MKKIIFAAMIGITIALSGCATLPPPTQQERAAADYGPAVTPQEAAQKIGAYFQATLIDPNSAIYRSSEKVEKFWMRAKNGEFRYGYATAFAVNAKNRMGGYTGEKRFIVVFYQGEVFRVSEMRREDDIYPDPYVFERHL